MPRTMRCAGLDLARNAGTAVEWRRFFEGGNGKYLDAVKGSALPRMIRGLCAVTTPTVMFPVQAGLSHGISDAYKSDRHASYHLVVSAGIPDAKNWMRQDGDGE